MTALENGYEEQLYLERQGLKCIIYISFLHFQCLSQYNTLLVLFYIPEGNSSIFQCTNIWQSLHCWLSLFLKHDCLGKMCGHFTYRIFQGKTVSSLLFIFISFLGGGKKEVALFVSVCVSVCACVFISKAVIFNPFFQSFFLQHETFGSNTLVETVHSVTRVAFSKSKTEERHENRTKEIKTLDMPQLSYAAVRNLIILSHRIMCPSEIILDQMFQTNDLQLIIFNNCCTLWLDLCFR